MSRRRPLETRSTGTVFLLMLSLMLLMVSSGRTEEQSAAEVFIKPKVLVEPNTQLKEISYSITGDECKITWTLHASETNRGVVTHRASCKVPLRDQATLMEDLLKRILADHPGEDAFRDLSWGRISPDFVGCTDMSLRLSLAAFQSSSWNRRIGKPAKGHANHFVALIAEQQCIYSELADLFNRRGRQLSVPGVEKVLVAKADTLSCYPALKAHGVRPDDKLPFDCQLWFAVKTAGAGSRAPRP
jgi:hypothetical protein